MKTSTIDTLVHVYPWAQTPYTAIHMHAGIQKEKTTVAREEELRKRCLMYPRKTTHLLPLNGLFPQI